MDKDEAVSAIIETLLALPPAQREEAFLEVRHNGVFCVHCGFGERDAPNAKCQCWNDE